MVTISLCMIVKNEEAVLARCLDSYAPAADEIIIVDTGSVDRTLKIAKKYTDKIYHFKWTGDFSAARNFAFSKARMEFILSVDADEILEGENAAKLLELKQAMLPEIDIVQMKYGNQLEFGTIYNFDEELRPKLFRRLREFRWTEPIHETVVLEPVVYDSDIVITHKPMKNHASRDIAVFEDMVRRGERLSKRLHNLYAKEIYVSGNEKQCIRAEAFFRESALDPGRSMDELKEACCVAARGARLRGDSGAFFKYALKNVAADGCSEICYELGKYYQDQKDYEEAALWFYNAAYETECILNIHCGSDYPLTGLALCYDKMGNREMQEFYRREAQRSAEEAAKG